MFVLLFSDETHRKALQSSLWVRLSTPYRCVNLPSCRTPSHTQACVRLMTDSKKYMCFLLLHFLNYKKNTVNQNNQYLHGLAVHCISIYTLNCIDAACSLTTGRSHNLGGRLLRRAYIHLATGDPLTLSMMLVLESIDYATCTCKWFVRAVSM